MKTAFTLEKVLKEVKQLELPARMLPRSFQLKGARGPASLSEVELPLTQPRPSFEARRDALYQELQVLIRSQHPLLVFWRKNARPWLKQIFWVE